MKTLNENLNLYIKKDSPNQTLMKCGERYWENKRKRKKMGKQKDKEWEKEEIENIK